MDFLQKSVLCLYIICSFVTRNYSQEITAPDSINYKLALDVSGARGSGIFSRTSLNFGGDLVIKRGKWEFHENVTYRFNNTNGLRLLNDWLNLSTLIYHSNTKWQWFPIALYQFENNLIYRIDRRHRYGLGLGAYPIDKDGYLLRFSAGWFNENEHYNGEIFINSELVGSNRQNHNSWIHIKNQIPLGKTKGSFGLDLWYMQSFKESTDFTIWFQPNVRVKFNEHFSFMIRYDYRFENVFLEPLVNANDILLFGLNLKFGN